ncbi:carboxylesterase family protein [Galbibacter mesophilus]|uniref:carboxylesterase family protein n=1 Tax=Galbibacter mesophilus TaxID=379069 RepID=UPI00191E56B5|nr:alpha/beta hydrolase-fold protein [Galbibacter mesophilus]MCM5662854.1 alpha/beta hydrolase-fold protein [Galbibacter mesophilus]
MKNRLKLVSFFILCFPMIMIAQHGLYEKSNFVKDGDTLRYRIMLPKNFTEGKEYPLVLFLHGAGERGSDNESQLTHGSSLFASEENRENFPAIVIFPQCPKDSYWSNADVDRSPEGGVKLVFSDGKEPTKALGLTMNLLDDFLEKPFVKKDQVYVVGLSMGGMGTFEILSRKPETFAAAIPICGGGREEAVKRYAKTPIWVFHGALDNVVSPLHSVKMVEALLEAGGKPKFTLYDNANHNSWDPAFAEPDFLKWLFSNTLTKQ